MTQALLYRGLALACLAGAGFVPTPGAAAQLLPGVQFAADARHPYSNIDRRNDAGNDTGDSQVERLNEGQLDQNYRGPYQPMPPRGNAGPPAQIYAAPPPGYAGPPPGNAGPPMMYAPPPPGYRPPGY